MNAHYLMWRVACCCLFLSSRRYASWVVGRRDTCDGINIVNSGIVLDGVGACPPTWIIQAPHAHLDAKANQSRKESQQSK